MLLTIAIPTYNRLDCLKLLLKSIISQIPKDADIHKTLEVMVCNNSSTDATQDYLDSLHSIKYIKAIQNDTNIGSTKNILKCFREAKGNYVWIIGDDDLPLNGAITEVMNLIDQYHPDALYLPAKWVNGSLVSYKNIALQDTHIAHVNTLEIIEKANSHVTFISSWVINKSSYCSASDKPNYERYIDTNLAHLEWILHSCLNSTNIITVKSNWIIARGGASGGYNLIDTFTSQYFNIINDQTSDKTIIKILTNSMLYITLPSFLWSMRNSKLGEFSTDGLNKILKPYYKNKLLFDVFIKKPLYSNVIISIVFRIIGKILGKLIRKKLICQ